MEANAEPTMEFVRDTFRAACLMAVDRHVYSGMVVGICGGLVGNHIIQRLRARMSSEAEKLQVTCVPSSEEALMLLEKFGVPFGGLTAYPSLDVTFDDANEVDANLAIIKCKCSITLAKIVAANSRKFVIVTSEDQVSEKLGQKWTKGVPIEVVIPAYMPVTKTLKTMGAKHVDLRRFWSEGKNMSTRTDVGNDLIDAYFGPIDDEKKPKLTDLGNCMIDAHFGPIDDPAALDRLLTLIPGVVSTGLFVDMVDEVFCALANGRIMTLEKQNGMVRT